MDALEAWQSTRVDMEVQRVMEEPDKKGRETCFADGLEAGGRIPRFEERLIPAAGKKNPRKHHSPWPPERTRLLTTPVRPNLGFQPPEL